MRMVSCPSDTENGLVPPTGDMNFAAPKGACTGANQVPLPLFGTTSNVSNSSEKDSVNSERFSWEPAYRSVQSPERSDSAMKDIRFEKHVRQTPFARLA